VTTLTIAIASYQRRDLLAALLRGLADELGDDADLASRVDVVVVLDGSTDGSLEMVESFDMPVAVKAVWKENGGLSSARNAGIAAATGDHILFLDDDLVPEPGLVQRHLRHHDGTHRVVVGPCALLNGKDRHAEVVRWWEDRYGRLAELGRITRFDNFSAANTSMPLALLREIGGFDERFRGYGMEDYEIGLRLLDAGVEIVFDAKAATIHHRRHTTHDRGVLRMQEAVNVVRFARMHPERLDDIVAIHPPNQWTRRLHRVGLRRPRALRAVWHLATRLMPLQQRFGGGTHLFYLADAATFSAGVASTGDRDLWDRLVADR
jgi:GT2 family glycosyltransferase